MNGSEPLDKTVMAQTTSADASMAASDSSLHSEQPDSSSKVATTSAVTLDHPVASTSQALPLQHTALGVKEEDEDAKLFTSLVNGIQNGALAAAAAAAADGSVDAVNGDVGASAASEPHFEGGAVLGDNAYWTPEMHGPASLAQDAPPISNGFGATTATSEQSPPFAMVEPESLGPIQAYAKLEFPGFSYYIQTLDFTIGRRPAHFRERYSDQQHITGASKAEGDVDVDLGPLKSISRFHVRVFYQDHSASISWLSQSEQQGLASQRLRTTNESPHNPMAGESEGGPRRSSSSSSSFNMNQTHSGSTAQQQAQGRFVLQVLGRNGACVDDVYVGKDAIVPLGRRTKIQIAERVFYFVLPPPSTQVETSHLTEGVPSSAQMTAGRGDDGEDELDEEEAEGEEASADDNSGSLGSSDEEDEKESAQNSQGHKNSKRKTSEKSASDNSDEEDGDTSAGSDSGDEEEDQSVSEVPKGDIGPDKSAKPLVPPTAPKSSLPQTAQPGHMSAASTVGPASVATPAGSTSPAAKKRKRDEPMPETAKTEPPAAAAPVVTETPTANKRKRNKKPAGPTTPMHMPGSMGGYPGMHQQPNPMSMFGSLPGGIVGPATAALLQQFAGSPGAAAALMAATGGGMSNLGPGGHNPYSVPPHMMSPMPGMPSPYGMGAHGGYGAGPPGMQGPPGQMGAPMRPPGSPYYNVAAAMNRGSPMRMERPDKSNIELIREAMSCPLAASRGGKLTLQEVYDYLAATYEYFRSTSRMNGPDWHNSIRHSIQGSKTIVKIPRKAHETPAKGTFYAFAGSEAAKQHATEEKGGAASDGVKSETSSPMLRPGTVSTDRSPTPSKQSALPASIASIASSVRPPPGAALRSSASTQGVLSELPASHMSTPLTPGTATMGPGQVNPIRPFPSSSMPTQASKSSSPVSPSASKPKVPSQSPRPSSSSPAPSGRVTIVIGRAPPSALVHVSSSPKTAMTQRIENLFGGPPIVHHEGVLFLSPQVFGKMSPQEINEIGGQGAAQALKILQSHLVTHLQTKMGPGDDLAGQVSPHGIAAKAVQLPIATPRPASSSRPPATAPARPSAQMQATSNAARPPLAGHPGFRPGPQSSTAARPSSGRPSAVGQPPSSTLSRPGLPILGAPANGRPALARPPGSRPSSQPPSASITRPGQAFNRPSNTTAANAVSGASARPVTRPLVQSRPPPAGQAVPRPGPSTRPLPGSSAGPSAPSAIVRAGATRPPSSLAGGAAASRTMGNAAANAVNGVQPSGHARPPGSGNRPSPTASSTTASALASSKAGSPVAGAPAKSSPGPAAASADLAQLLALLGGGKIDSGKLTPAQHELLQRAGRLAAEQQKAQQAKAAAAAASAGEKAGNQGAPSASTSGKKSSSSTEANPAPAPSKDVSSVSVQPRTEETNAPEPPSTEDDADSPAKPSPPTTRAQAAASSSPSKAGASKTASTATPPKTRSAAAAAHSGRASK